MIKKILTLIVFFFVLGASLFSGKILEKIEKSNEIKVLFVGDMMFDRTIRKIGEKEGYEKVFSCLSEEFQKYDAIFGNLEGPITKNNSVNLNTLPGGPNNMTFTFPLEIADLLYKNNFKAVSLANNHIFDFGKSDVEETREALIKAKVDWFGDPTDLTKKTYFYDERIAVVGFNQFLGVDSVEGTVKEIKKIKTGDKENEIKIVVFAHWGEEYIEANRYQKLQAHAFIDAGADLVLGAHPHVIQEIETYKDKKIYYSLGNFIFDQWWEPKVRKGMGVEVTLKGDSLTTDTILFESSRTGQTCPLK